MRQKLAFAGGIFIIGFTLETFARDFSVNRMSIGFRFSYHPSALTVLVLDTVAQICDNVSLMRT